MGATEQETQYRLFRCNTCGMGAVAAIRMVRARGQYPGDAANIEWFHPESGERLPLPDAVPRGIAKEFREAEMCAESGCLRAAAAMFRSVLEKTLRANGYDTDAESNLMKKMAAACDDGVITQARKRRADEDVRVLGNDILHDDWHEIALSDVEAAHRYAQRVIEDLYDDREVVLRELAKAGRCPTDTEGGSE